MNNRKIVMALLLCLSLGTQAVAQTRQECLIQIPEESQKGSAGWWGGGAGGTAGLVLAPPACAAFLLLSPFDFGLSTATCVAGALAGSIAAGVVIGRSTAEQTIIAERKACLKLPE